MSAIPLNAIGQAYITLAPPWSYRMFKLGRLRWGPGQMPPHLERYATDSTFRMANLRKAQARVKAFATGRSKRR